MTEPRPKKDGKTDPGKKGKKKGKRKRGRRAKYIPALDLHVLSVADIGDDIHIPHLFTSMTTDRPGMDPAGAARRMFAQEKKRGLQPGYITGDGLYAQAKAASFQIPARECGFKVILPVLDEATGVQGAHETGFLLVDGTPYCPALPEHLRNVVADLRAGRIDLKTFGERIRLRKKFEMVTKQNPDQHGIGERIGCRAADHSLTVCCSHKPNSMKERKTLNRNGYREDNRAEVFLPVEALTNGLPPTICQVQAVTLKPSDLAKYRQAIPIGDIHTNIYNRLRQGHEGMNGFIKDPAREAIGEPARRRIRTKVAQQLICAFLLAASNLRKIRSFFAKAKEDENGDYCRKRIRREGEHARSGMPPGTPFKTKKAPPRESVT